MFRGGRQFEKNTHKCEKARLFFHWFFMENRWKNRRVFSQRRVFFSNWRPPRNTVFYDTKATFSFFEFLIFFEKSMKKTTENFTCQKSRKITPGGPQNTPKILKKWLQNRQKSRKMPKKLIFWGVDFLMIFWMAKKSKKGGIPIMGEWVLLALGSTGGL